MFKIIDYRLVGHASLEDFNILVVKMICEGWQPFGSPFDSDKGWMQALVRYTHD